jgi:hypothetical protein
MRVSGNQYVAIRRRHREQGALGTDDFLPQCLARRLEKQPHVRRNLIIPAARRVQLRGGWHTFRERLLDVHVHILELHLPFEFARFDFTQDGVETRVNGVTLLRRDEPRVREHGRMRLAAGNVEGREAAVERHGLTELQHQLGGTGGEPPAPRCVGRLGHEVER